MSNLNGHEHDKLTLSPADAAAVDALLDTAESGAPVDAARKQQAAAWLGVLNAAPAPAIPADLAQRTLSAVLAADRMRIPERVAAGAASDAPAASPRWRRRFTEFGAMGIAAMLFVAVLLAGLNQAQRSQVRIACVANMNKISTAFGTYSSTTGGNALPMIAMPSNKNWLRGSIDGAMTNAAHITPLINGGYVPVAAFSCPGQPTADTAVAVTHTGPFEFTMGYSYRNMYAYDKPTWDGAVATIILTDRNPLFVAAPKSNAQAGNSNNHDGHGNNVLHADGSVSWATSPNIGPANDNIWTIGAGSDRLLTYKGAEIPGSLLDVIVCP